MSTDDCVQINVTDSEVAEFLKSEQGTFSTFRLQQHIQEEIINHFYIIYNCCRISLLLTRKA